MEQTTHEGLRGGHADPFTPAVERGPRILARTFYRELQAQGFSHDQILAFASEIIALVTVEIDPVQR